MKNERRVAKFSENLLVHVLLTIFTLGIWQLIWSFKTTDRLNAEKNELARNPVTKLLLCLLLPLYWIFWTDQSAKRVDKVAREAGVKSSIRIWCTIVTILSEGIMLAAAVWLYKARGYSWITLVWTGILALLLTPVINVIPPILMQCKMNKIASTGKTFYIRGVKVKSWDDLLLYGATDIILCLLLAVVAYPIIYVLSCSFSSGTAVSSGQVLLWPVDFSIQGYKVIFNYRSVWVGFGNSIFYTVLGTILDMVLSVLAAYPLSRPNYQGRKLFMGMFTFTMVFSAGIIPKYLLMSNLHLTNTRWALILASSISAYNMIIIRTYFQNSIPGELIEAARIDGCSELRTLWSVVLPLSKAVLSVVTLYYAVGHWNSYFGAMLYLRDRKLQPLQIVLRDILAASRIDLTEIQDPELVAQMVGAADLVKYALIVISSAPIIAAYPFVQKFFKTGVMIGSVKG